MSKANMPQEIVHCEWKKVQQALETSATAAIWQRGVRSGFIVKCIIMASVQAI